MRSVEDLFKEAVKSDVSKRNFVNSMTTIDKPFVRLWRPHNYRRAIKIVPLDKKVKTTMFQKSGFIVGTTIPYKKSDHTQIVDVCFSDNISVQIARETITVTWKQNLFGKDKETLLLGGSSKREVLFKIDCFRDHVESLIEDAVRLIIAKLDLMVIGGFYEVRREDWSRSKHFIDKLSKDCIVHEDHWKKVYEYGVEVVEKKGDDEEDFFKQLISNELVLDFVPEIAFELQLNRFLTLDVVRWCEIHITAVNDVFNYPFIKYLPGVKRLEISNYLFERFGGL